MIKKESALSFLFPFTATASILIIIGLIKTIIDYFMTGIFYYATIDGITLLIVFAMMIYLAIQGYIDIKKKN